jgi:hypothetical protein
MQSGNHPFFVDFFSAFTGFADPFRRNATRRDFFRAAVFFLMTPRFTALSIAL